MGRNQDKAGQYPESPGLVMRKELIYLQLVRPRTLPVSIGPVIVGLALSGFDFASGEVLTGTLVILCAVLLQIGANVANDYYDHVNKVDSEERLGPERVMTGGLLSAAEVKLAYKIVFGTALVIGLYLVSVGGWPIGIIGLLSILAAYFYTAGPKPLSYYATGEILALIFYGPLAVWGTYILMTGTRSFYPFLIGLGPGFIAWTLMAINNMRDMKTDKKSGKTTLAVLVGEKKSRILPIIGVVGSSLFALLMMLFYASPLFLIPALCSLLFLGDWYRVVHLPIDKNQNKSLAAAGKYSFVYNLLISIVLFTII